MFHQQLIDSLLFVITVLATVVYCYYIQKKKILALSKGLAFSLVFLTLYTYLNICAHLIAVTTVALIKAGAGTFVYDLRFYTLIQFGVLLAIINSYLLRRVNRIALGDWNNYQGVYKACLLQILITLPLFPFNPISLLPTLTAVPLMVLVFRVRRRYTFVSEIKAEINTPELILNATAS
ncbi:MAG: hypothetical protein M3142_04350 [Bacteroidota bacterium]|nr:hypothetical protein [Bacteroidota bacterium]